MLWLLWLPATLAAPRIFPLVDPGLFVISGVSTCGAGGGYCLLGLDCTLDEDFLPDLGDGQHCEGLRSAFTPSAHFVCCRAATNRSTFKPPLLISSIPTTEKSTTLSILENEIDQVVLKVAQSVDSIKTVTAETWKEKGAEDGEEHMLADSPEEDDEESGEEEESEESEEERQPTSSSETDSSSEVTESSSSEEGSSEEFSDYKTESSENVVQQYHGSEMVINKNESLLKINTTTQQSVFYQTENYPEQSDDKSSNIIPLEGESLEQSSLKESSLQNEIIHEVISKDSSDESGEDTSDIVTPDQGVDQVTPKTQMNKDSGKVPAEVSSAPRPPTLVNTSNFNSPNASPTTKSPSEFVTPSTNTKGGINNMQMIGENKTDATWVSKEIATTNNPPQSTTQDRLGTTTTVSPGPDNGQRPPMGEVTQGQPKPCSRNCSEQIMFEFQNKPLCFGSMFTADWIVTSASCALRIFRMGMVNVNASLADSSRRSIKTIVVHESYGESSGPSGQEIEANNIGLVRVAPGPSGYCLACLPSNGQLPRDNCTAVSPTSSRTQAANCTVDGGCEGRASPVSEGRSAVCEGPSRLFRDHHGFFYISLACDTPWPRTVVMGDVAPTKPWGRGTPLFCDGVLAGVEASVGAGSVVYTPLSHYVSWLDRNTRPGLPEQHFNLG